MNREQILQWAQQMQAIAQAGLAYGKDPFDMERFQQLRDLSVEMVECLTEEAVKGARKEGEVARPAEVAMAETTNAVRAGAAAVMTDAEFGRHLLRDAFASEAGYPNPKIDVRAAVFREGKILMVRENGEWSLPGGFADVGLSLYENVAKEVLEEAGFVVKPTKLLAALDLRKHPHPPMLFHCYKFIVRCEILEELGLQENIETDGVGFFAEDDLPVLSLARNTPEQIGLVFAHGRDPGRETGCE